MRVVGIGNTKRLIPETLDMQAVKVELLGTISASTLPENSQRPRISRNNGPPEHKECS
jgi:hypothetical protein